MDYYVSEFNKWMGNCQVMDYAVFLEKKVGFDRFNPFSDQEQMVLFLTDRGIFCVRVRGMGEFCKPAHPINLDLRIEDERIFCEASGKQYKFIRKWKEGSTDSYRALAAELRTAL